MRFRCRSTAGGNGLRNRGLNPSHTGRDPIDLRFSVTSKGMYPSDVRISIDDPKSADIVALIAEHLSDMHATSPAESVHALNPAALTDPAVTFWSARSCAGVLLGVGALQRHQEHMGEVKSMRTAQSFRGRGVAIAVLDVIVTECRTRGLREVNLETGTQEYFSAARRLYVRYGFVSRGPFASYSDDANSAYFALAL